MFVGKTVPNLLKVVLVIHAVLRCSAQIAWPVGTYGLPKPNSGCPTGWSEGYRYHDTEDDNPGNQWSDPLDLDGTWGQANMEYNFCMKTQSSLDGEAWPAGSYCIYKKGDCPSGFQSGSIRWDDEDSANINREGGTKPDGTYDHNTIIFFCCRNDDVTSQAISLPRADRFMLLSRFDSCQQVRGMTVTKEWFRWDNEDSNNGDSQTDVHPYEGIQSGGENVRLNFCFYAPDISQSWPDGTYGLPKSLAGCPSGWEEGYRYHDTEDSGSNNQWSDPLHLAGTWDLNNMRNEFCMKTVADFAGPSGADWPQGNYCIYRWDGSCPSGFVTDQDTYIYWDDEDSSNANSFGGVLPDGVYNGNTRMQFCCREDGVTSLGMSLPTDNTFYLFASSTTCQEVAGMTVTPEWFRWDNEDSSNADSQSEEHPCEGIESSGENVRLTLCYYVPQ
ncbi:uncharacterized protein LOC581886 [Strongylocentrotus purpuratus]|uniref:Apextrin C-terminal domain-containing protein n=1 Tax=Strongylocentrotus purpuratus TaxID=7668 RepID=A0A7M7RBZ8_STRPU|nr:uncharacterized protein LOC581886 [Strongylocentrotus purpuratus]